jgi:hypothetical protein
MEFEPKWLVSLRAFEGRLADRPVPPRFLFLGRRTLRSEPRIRAASRSDVARALARDMVVGVGLYQGVEFVLQQGLVDLLRRWRSAARRVRAAFALARRAESFVLELSRCPTRNAAFVADFLGGRRFGEQAR